MLNFPDITAKICAVAILENFDIHKIGHVEFIRLLQ